MPASHLFDIRDYGADADRVNTTALQAAIDACHEAGGGAVLCPPGTWRIGTIWLKSHVELHLARGCTLLGSADPADYNAGDPFPEHETFASENVSAAHLVLAYRAEDIAITGGGCIDGNSDAFCTAGERPAEGFFPRPAWRPGQMILFCRCRRIQVQDVLLRHAPYWTCFLHGCSDVQIRGITIDNDVQVINTDGIDVDCCQRVTISDCLLTCGDDCITARANSLPLGDAAGPCEDLVVSNCVLRGPLGGVRVGVGSGLIRRCTFTNLAIHGGVSAGLLLLSRYSDRLPRGAELRDLIFSNIVMDAHTPIYLGTGAGGTAPVQDIVFTDMLIRGRRASYVGGETGNPVRNITLRNLDWRLQDGEPKRRLPIPDIEWTPSYRWRRMAVPTALTLRHLEDVCLDNIRFSWGDQAGVQHVPGPQPLWSDQSNSEFPGADSTWQHAIWATDVNGLHMHRVVAPVPPDGDQALRLERVENID